MYTVSWVIETNTLLFAQRRRPVPRVTYNLITGMHTLVIFLLLGVVSFVQDQGATCFRRVW